MFTFTARDLVVFLAGMFTMAFVLGFFVPDKWAMWFVSFRNVPSWLAVLAVLILGPTLYIVFAGSGQLIVRSLAVTLSQLHINKTLSLLIAVGLCFLLPWLFVRLWRLIFRRGKEAKPASN